MSEFRMPYFLSEQPSSYQDPDKFPELFTRLVRNYNELIADYNALKANLDAEVFYHIIPMVDGSVETTGTFTQSDRVKVVITNAAGVAIEYWMSLEAV